jgi:hypothetical protein
MGGITSGSFKPGHSGNPGGRPKGSIEVRNLAREHTTAGERLQDTRIFTQVFGFPVPKGDALTSRNMVWSVVGTTRQRLRFHPNRE